MGKKSIYAIYWGISKKADTTDIDCIAYQKDFTNPIRNYNALEFLVTAPELPIKYMDKNGNFIRINNKKKKKRIEKITILLYINKRLIFVKTYYQHLKIIM